MQPIKTFCGKIHSFELWQQIIYNYYFVLNGLSTIIHIVKLDRHHYTGFGIFKYNHTEQNKKLVQHFMIQGVI